ncbi:MAG: hypothetical protein KAT34_18180 [Candidatus Aminicenantes bacterium]|nr:hypothetical protein [Candidatus Aminicenantes bacterium]
MIKSNLYVLTFEFLRSNEFTRSISYLAFKEIERNLLEILILFIMKL